MSFVAVHGECVDYDMKPVLFLKVSIWTVLVGHRFCSNPSHLGQRRAAIGCLIQAISATNLYMILMYGTLHFRRSGAYQST